MTRREIKNWLLIQPPRKLAEITQAADKAVENWEDFRAGCALSPGAAVALWSVYLEVEAIRQGLDKLPAAAYRGERVFFMTVEDRDMWIAQQEGH